MSFSEKIDINCDYNEVNNDTCDENNEEIENHRNYKKDSVKITGKETFKKLKKIISHVGLLIALMLYTASGGLVRTFLSLLLALKKKKTKKKLFLSPPLYIYINRNFIFNLISF